MTLDVFFREDIANILRSINMAGGMPPDLEQLLIENNDAEQLAMLVAAYRHGHTNALQATAAAVGIVTLGGGE